MIVVAIPLQPAHALLGNGGGGGGGGGAIIRECMLVLQNDMDTLHKNYS